MTIRQMSFNLLLILLFIAPASFAQTPGYIKVSGTKCSIIPPEGFTAATRFSGFESATTGASIMINEIPTAYEGIADAFTAEALKTKGMTLVSKETIDFNHSPATLVNVTQSANGITYIKQMLIFGDAKATVLVNGIYPESSKNIGEVIKKALLSTVYNEDQNENPLDAATFSIDVKDTDFKLIKYMSGALVYSTDGKIPTEKPTLIVANSIAKVAVQDQKQYAQQRLKRLPRGEQNVIREIKEITIDRLLGYEIIADGKTKDGGPELVYLLMLFNESGDYYLINGQAKEDFDKNLAAYKKIAKTFKRK